VVSKALIISYQALEPFFYPLTSVPFDYAQIKDLSKGDVIELARGKYRAVRDRNGFNLYVLGSGGRKDLIADVITPRKFRQLPSDNFSISPNQTIAKIFYGATES
jgi:hypothetical protein